MLCSVRPVCDRRHLGSAACAGEPGKTDLGLRGGRARQDRQGIHRTRSARWEVAQDGDNHVLAQKAKNDDGTFNVALVDGTSYKDVDLSVRLRAVAGETRPGRRRGLAGEGQEELLHRPLQPARRQLPRLQGRGRQADPVPVGQGPRRREVAHATGDDGRAEDHLLPRRQKYLEAEDATFPEAGKIGLWSKADAQSYFDDLTASE